ncbi:DUF742 domain-containing protein [Streptomyces sp. SP17BM10]|uniref:DUF742 domain-containing protein n=1 Tax=Streptomyces sp. SP17BM10 TaxID=3002530 RepID=UPI002E7805F9|nr:DUF742 domain-containing protein [Streptomyces sp. SP17BM10]
MADPNAEAVAERDGSVAATDGASPRAVDAGVTDVGVTDVGVTDTVAVAGADGTAGDEFVDEPGDEAGDESEVDLFRPRTPVDDRWFDDDAGPVVRLYSMTRGRTRPVEDGLFDLISLITAAEPGPDAGAVPAHVLDPEHQTILAWCRREPLSVAELGSFTDLPVSVVRVLLGDLYDAELISVTRPVPLAELPDERLLRDVINGLRAL